MTDVSLTSYDVGLAVKATSSPPRLVPFTKIESILGRLLSTREGVEEIMLSQKEALCLGSRRNGVSSLPIQTAGQYPQPTLKCGKKAQVCIKTGYKENGNVLVSKVAAGGGDASNTGAVFVFDQTTLRLSSILCDEGLLTEVRTAAACVFATREILNNQLSQVNTIGLIGGGVQAVWQLRFLGAILDSREVVLKTQSLDSANAFIQRMANSSYPMDREWNFQHCGDEAFTKCQLIHTMTPARTPVLLLQDISTESFLHITCVGADAPGKCEIESSLIEKADCLYCDSILQSKERGEYQSSRNFMHLPNLIEIGSVFHKESSAFPKGFLTIFDSSGLAIQDVEMASLIAKHI